MAGPSVYAGAVLRPSPNFDARNGPIRFVVLHYTGMATLDAALSRLTDPAPIAGHYPGPWQDPATPPDTPLGRVSAHYVVAEDGAVFALVGESDRAWHAGASSWRGIEGVNDASIGIEIANGGHDFGLPAFQPAQIEAVIVLLRDILARHGLGPEAVVGHSDIAPGRKLDPGERFDWLSLVRAGVAVGPPTPQHEDRRQEDRRRFVGPGDQSDHVAAVQEALACIGYRVAQHGDYDEATQRVVEAFQRRFRPSCIDGVVDRQCLALINDLADRLA